MVKHVRFDEENLLSLSGREAGDVRGGAGGWQDDDIYKNCKGWYRYACLRLLERMGEMPTIFHGKDFVSCEDIIEHVIYEDPKACTSFVEAWRCFTNTISNVEESIVSGKWKNKTRISGVSSSMFRDHRNLIHRVKNLDIMVHWISNDIYHDYGMYGDASVAIYPPKRPLVEMPSLAARVTNEPKLREVIEASIPYLLALEDYHIQISSMLYSITGSIVEGFKLGAWPC